MRSCMLVLAVAAAVPFSACSDSVAAARRDDALVLEVGGDHRSLRASLLAAGVGVDAPRALRDGADPAGSGGGGGGGGGEHAADAAVAPRPDAEASPTREQRERTQSSTEPSAPDHLVVTLAPGQTLIHLARKHLGDGNRFREILALNGWSDADSRRLQAGQRVKVPRVTTGRSTRR